MINRKLFLAAALLASTVAYFGMQAQQPPAHPNNGQPAFDRDIANQYKHLMHRIIGAEHEQERMKFLRNSDNGVFKTDFSFAGYCAWITGCYKLLGKTRLSSHYFINGILSFLIGIWCGKITTFSVNIFSHLTNMGGISHAIAHRLHPEITEKKAYLSQLYQQEARLRPAVIDNQSAANATIAQLQAQQQQIAARRAQAEDDYDEAMRQLHQNTENDAQVRQARDEFVNHFEQYLNHAYESFLRTRILDCDINFLIKAFYHYVDLFPTKLVIHELITLIDEHASEIIVRTLQLYFFAVTNTNIGIQNQEQFNAMIKKIAESNYNNPPQNVRDFLMYNNLYYHSHKY